MGGREQKTQSVLSWETAHELNNIFGTLLANAELLLDSCAGREEETTRIHRILKSCARGVSLVEQIREEGSPYITPPADTAKLSPTGHILLVEDDPDMLELEARILHSHGYRVISCRDGSQAFTLFLENPQAIDLLLTDLELPGVNGVELIKEIHAIRPGLPCMLLTGGGQFIPPDELFMNNCTLLNKPINRTSLLAAVKNQFSQSPGLTGS